MATIPVHIFLVVHTMSADDLPKTTRSVIGLLRACGYQVDEHNNEIRHVAPTTNSFAWGEIGIVCQPLITHALKAHLAGKIQIAKHLLAFAASLERISSGGDAETSKVRRKYFI